MSNRRRLRTPNQVPSRDSGAPATFWNGETCTAIRCRVTVGKSMAPTWWCAELEGTVREAVRVEYGEQVFYLDNEDGSGWRKVTEGHGSPRWAHNSLPDGSQVVLADAPSRSADG